MAEANVTTNKQLPAEVLVNIFKHCDVSELVNVVDVCQLWRDVVIHQHMPRNDLVIRRPSDINDLVSLLCKPVSFAKLHIVWDVPYNVDCSSVSLDALANATSLNQLQSFTFKVKDGDEHRVLDALLALIVQTSTETLTHLELFNTGFIVTWKVVELIETCQHLSHLVLNGCYLKGYEQRCKDIIPTLTHLELLDLRGTGVSSSLSFIAAVKRGCANISNNIMIHELDVRPPDDVSMLQFVSHVDSLNIVEFNTEQLGSLIGWLNEHVSQLSVDRLQVGDCKNHVTDDILLSLVKRLRGLKVVGAFQCQELSNEGVVNVIASSPQLERVYMHDVKNISTGIVQLLDRVVTSCQNVEIYAYGTKLSDEMRGHPSDKLYTGKNGNICLRWRS